MGVFGGLLGALGGGDKTKERNTSKSGYYSLPDTQKNFVNNELWSKILAYANQGYQRMPTRRAGELEQDPNFGSRAQLGLQNWRDQMMGGQSPAPAQQATAAASGGQGLTTEAILGRLMAMQKAGMGGIYSNKASAPYERFMQKATDKDYADLQKANSNGDSISAIITRYMRG